MTPRPDRRRPDGKGASSPSGPSAKPGAGSGLSGKAQSLKHEVALLGEGGAPAAREIRTPALQEECGGDPGHPLAREVIAQSKAGRLRCPVCGSVVERVFPDRESSVGRWHFRRRAGEGECDHEGETVQHRDSKTALARALRSRLPHGWEVHLERALENGRRPDVLAVHPETGDRVAFEVQYANLPRSGWRERHLDYASLGVRDYWLLGAEKRYERRRDDLADILKAEPGQRLIHIGRFEPEGPIELLELALSYLDPDAPSGLEDHPILAPPSLIASLPPERLQSLEVRALKLSYPLEDLGLHLGPTGPAFLVTPLDERNGRRERVARRLAEAERERLEREAAADAEREREIARVLAHWRQAQDAWLGSVTRRRAVEKLGSSTVESLEREVRRANVVGETPGALRRTCRSGGWRVIFYLNAIAPLPPGKPFDWSEARDGYLASKKRLPPRTPGPASPAWADLRRRLVDEGHLVSLGGERLAAPIPATTVVAHALEGPQEDPPSVSAETGTVGRRLRRLLGRFL